MKFTHLAGLGITTLALAGAIALTTMNADAQPQGGPSHQQMGDLLVNGLKATPGCLGVETAQTQSGKNVIFAWFEDKEAAMAWYESPMHKRMMGMMMPDRDKPEGYEPMKHIPDDAGPILTIASLKFTDRPLPGMRMPISEISIEMYSPLPGGLRINGGFTPSAVPVEHRQEATIAPADAAPSDGAETGDDR